MSQLDHSVNKSEFAISEGPVAYLDILGFKKIIEKNSTEYGARLIEEYLSTLVSRINDYFQEKLQEVNGAKHLLNIQRVQNQINILNVSDSIIITLDISRSTNPSTANWITFLAYIMLSYAELFNKGLPSRGCVSWGEFFISSNKTIWVSKAILEAHEISENLELAGIVFSKSANDKIRELQLKKEFSFPRKYIVEYNVPCKNESKSMDCLSPGLIEFLNAQCVDSEVNQSFSMHNKPIDCESVKVKMENTKSFIKSLCFP